MIANLFLNCQLVIAYNSNLMKFNRQQQDERRSDGAEPTETTGLHRGDIHNNGAQRSRTKKRAHEFYFLDGQQQLAGELTESFIARRVRNY
jgi:hypothetical protein